MERKELFVTNIDEIFEPQELIAEGSEKKKWNVIPYQNNEFSGKLIHTTAGAAAGTLTYDPKLKGWYKIYVTTPTFPSVVNYLKLSSDFAYTYYSNMSNNYMGMEEYYWKAADMTDVSIIFNYENAGVRRPSSIAAFRFVPMSDEEAAAYVADGKNPNTKRIYYCDDMNNRPLFLDMKEKEQWLSALIALENTDVEWFSPEIYDFDHVDYAPWVPGYFGGKGKYTYWDVISTISEKAHEIGIKVAPAIRMGLWGMCFPHFYGGTGEVFSTAHPEFACVDRNGDRTSAMSYAFPEIRKLRIDTLVQAAKSGADAVTLAACRGIPYMLFEKPVADEFYEKYGEYPYELPLDDPRLNAVHCDIMTRLFRELREALDEACGKDKVEIHLVGLYSIEDDLLHGFDVERLAREGLVNAIGTHTRRLIEIVPDSIRKDDDPERIDIEKYNKFIREETSALFLSDGSCFEPQKNSRGEDIFPKSKIEATKQWKAFSDKYGIKIYSCGTMFFEGTSPKTLQNLAELYDAGMYGMSIWNAPCLSTCGALWDFCRKLGHVDGIANRAAFPDGYKTYRVIKYGNCNINRYKPIWGG